MYDVQHEKWKTFNVKRLRIGDNFRCAQVVQRESVLFYKRQYLIYEFNFKVSHDT
jgi:hypothetical protein